jgi:hypothetical protein
MDNEQNDPNDEEFDNISKQYYAVRESMQSSSTELSLNKVGQSKEKQLGGIDDLNDVDEEDEEELNLTWREKLAHFYEKESLLVEVALAIILAYLYPILGAQYLFPDVTAHWIAVIIIFCEYIV